MKKYGYDESNVVQVSLADEFGWQSERLELVGTKAGGGRTQFSVIRVVEALKEGKSVLFFSTESEGEDIGRRIINELAPTVLDKKSAEFALTTDEKKSLKEAMQFVREANLIVDDKHTISEGYIDGKVKLLADKEQGVDLVVVDAIHLVKTTGNLDNHLRVGKILRGFDNLANLADCEFLVTAQMNVDNKLSR